MDRQYRRGATINAAPCRRCRGSSAADSRARVGVGLSPHLRPLLSELLTYSSHITTLSSRFASDRFLNWPQNPPMAIVIWEF